MVVFDASVLLFVFNENTRLGEAIAEIPTYGVCET